MNRCLLKVSGVEGTLYWAVLGFVTNYTVQVLNIRYISIGEFRSELMNTTAVTCSVFTYWVITVLFTLNFALSTLTKVQHIR